MRKIITSHHRSEISVSLEEDNKSVLIDINPNPLDDLEKYGFVAKVGTHDIPMLIEALTAISESAKKLNSE